MTTPITIANADPVALPAPVGLLYFFLMLTFALHVIPMTMTLGGGFWALVAARGAGRRAGLGLLSVRLARGLPIWTAATVTTGVAALLFLQVLYGQAFYSAAVIIGWPWLSVVFLVVAGYYGYYFRSYRLGAQPRAAWWAGAAAWVAFLLIAFVYVAQMTLMLHPERHLALYAQVPGGTRLALVDPALLPRYAHMTVAALGISAIWIAALGALAKRRGEQEDGAALLRFGAQGFFGAAGLQMLVGVWLVASLPAAQWRLFLGASPLATASLFVGVVAMIAGGAMLLLAPGSARPGSTVVGASALAFVGLVAMAGARDVVRRATLGDAIDFEQMATAPQWGAIALFLVLLVAGVATIAWLLVAVQRSRADLGAAVEPRD